MPGTLTLLDDNGSTPSRELVKPEFVRPLPTLPSDADLAHNFSVFKVVDAFSRDGWWTGVITRIVDHNSLIVAFQNPPDVVEFRISDLRIHRSWIDGKWVRPENKNSSFLSAERHARNLIGSYSTEMTSLKDSSTRFCFMNLMLFNGLRHAILWNLTTSPRLLFSSFTRLFASNIYLKLKDQSLSDYIGVKRMGELDNKHFHGVVWI